MVAAVRKYYDGTLIVGGGIRTPEAAGAIAKAGADIIVVGTMIEKDGGWQQKLSLMLKSMRQARS
jgi:phosphoglycerol geranylgeranyltransferase